MRNCLIPALVCACFVPLFSANDEFSNGNLLFTANIYKQLKNLNAENLLVSPFSLKIILALVAAGSLGDTASELETTLKLPKDSIQKFENFLSTLTAKDQAYDLRLANKIYLAKDCSIKDHFKTISTEFFKSSIENLDFSKKAQAAATMNKWIEQQTKNAIRDLINPLNINDNTRMFLINALYFKADWATPFFVQGTKKRDFHVDGEKVEKVDTMHEILSYFKYFESKALDAKFLEMPFEGDGVSMVFVLPNKRDGLKALEDNVEKILLHQEFTWDLVNVSIPKFKIDSKIDFEDILTNLGLKKVFSFGEANFSGISDEKLAINDIIQKSVIDVSEKGVEAASATFIRIVEYSGMGDPEVEFHADHPFIFYIKVKTTILFVGRVVSPRY